MDFFFAALPIAFLIVAMTKRRPLPSTHAFLFGALLALVTAWWHFGISPQLLGAAVVSGLLDALTPISIVFGAIFFFVAMEKTGAMRVLQEWLRDLSTNPVAQIMIVGFAFIFLIEASAGFGTPAALAAPMLVVLGFPALRVAVVCLIFNTIPTAFGAVGTPVWFGFELLGLSSGELVEVGWRGAIFQTAASLVVPVVALRLLIPTWTIWRNLFFIYASILSCVLPMLLVARFNYEFPAIVGGVVGMPVTIILARLGIGLEKSGDATVTRVGLWSRTLWLALTPLLLTVFLLLVTRIPELGLRGLLTAGQPAWEFGAEWFGSFLVSAALVVQWQNLFGQGLNWSHAILYVPSLIPFVLTASLAVYLYRCGFRGASDVLKETCSRITTPVLALFGALVFVNVLMVGGDRSSTMVLGQSLASASGESWRFFAPFLGTLGSFFSGSTTISNLTFGPIQLSIASDTGTDPSLLLALQLSGAAMGNMVCIHNIVAVCAVLGLINREGEILKLAALPTLLFGVVLAVVVLLGFS